MEGNFKRRGMALGAGPYVVREIPQAKPQPPEPDQTEKMKCRLVRALRILGENDLADDVVRYLLVAVLMVGIVVGQMERDGTIYQVAPEPHYGEVDRGTVQGPYGAGTVDKDGQFFVVTPGGQVQQGQIEKDGSLIFLPGPEE
jgi:hypothetical protein